MAKLGDLVVRIGADTRDLNRQLGRVQRNMRAMTGNFERMGQNLTRSLTLPLAAIGATAIKSAADLETLETSFVSLTGGAAEAAAMMANLNEFTARTPFQIEAVANAARQLIASGTEISQVNMQLQFLGDIAATSGSSIEEIAAIFAKVNAKGKVELENLNQLAERGIPIFKALADATGLPADALGAGAVSVEEFNQVLKGFAEEGGFAAGAMERLSQTAAGKFSTAVDNLKLAGASLADKVLPKVSELLDKITSLAQGFTKLDPGVRDLIVNFGLLAAALGPVIGFLPQILTQLKLITSLIGGGGIGIAVAALTALVTTFATLRKEVVTIQDRLNDAQRDANAAAAQSIADVRTLVYEFGLQNTSMERKEQILQRLQEISPRYYSHLKDATTTVDLLTAATDRYTASIKAQARQQAVQQAEEEQLKAIADRQREVLEYERQRNKLVAKYDTNLDGIVSLTERAAAAQDSWFAGFDFETLDQLSTKIRVGEEDIERMTQELVDFRNEFATVGEGVNEVSADLDKMNSQTQLNTESQEELNEAIDKSVPHLNEASHAITDFSEGTLQAAMSTNDLLRMLTNVQVQAQATKQEFIDMGDVIRQALSGIASAFDGTGNFIMKGLRILGDLMVGIGNQMIALATTMKKFRKFIITNPGLAIAAGVGFVIAGTALANMAQRNLEMPALAEGGVAFGPTMALIGDNKNASIDPEVVAPLSKLRDMMGGNQVEVFGRISGNDIFLSNARAGTNRNRYA